MDEIIIETAYKKALEVLKMNSTKHGFSSTTEKYSNYFSVWSRDHSICSIAVALTDDKELIKTAKTGILLLLKKQLDYGQVPSYIEIENRKVDYGGFGSITSVDSNMWVAIAAAVLHKKTKDKRFITNINMVRYARLYRLLKAFDSNNCGLIEVPKAGDWADIFNRTYHVLYDECLYYEALKSLQYLFICGLDRCENEGLRKKINKKIKWIRKRRAKVKKRINNVFWFTKENIPSIFEEYMIYDKIEEKEYGFYQSHLIPFKIHWHKRFESFGNVLAIAVGIANRDKSRKIIRYVKQNKINEPFPMRALYPPVYKNEKGWEPIYRIKEQPHTYHNGGIWPVIAGFWIYALMKKRFSKTALKEINNLAVYLEKNNWHFNEYFNGRTMRAMGRSYQAWSAAGFVIAYHSVKNNPNIFDY